MLNWDLSNTVFNLDRVFFGRVHRIMNEVRQWAANPILRNYSELKRLVTIMAEDPPEDTRVRLTYKVRIEELYGLIDYQTGGYLTRYAQGDNPAGIDTPWFDRWPGVDQDFFPSPPEKWTAKGF